MAEMLRDLQLAQVRSKAELKTIIRDLCSAQLATKKSQRAEAKDRVRTLSADIKNISRKRQRLLKVADLWTSDGAAAAAAAAAAVAPAEGEGEE